MRCSLMKNDSANLRNAFACLAILVVLGANSRAAGADDSPMQRNFHDSIGLQLYSLRAQAKMNPIAALDLAKRFGFREIETAGTGDMPVDHFAAALRERGLKAVSAHFPYDRFDADI